ncbi:hypothetical protein K1719_003465 [Acacia pycnantha]|nr:hypothetical protein K1719_003465 [Acacia pycnantha]
MADFWLLFLVFIVGIGSGVTVLNNLTQIGIAQVVEDTTILLSISSFCNFVGRLSGGFASEHSEIIMTISYLIFAFVVKGTLFFAVVVLSVCYGVQFSMMIPTESELFGLKQFSVLYNFMSLGNPVGAFLFSALLAGQVLTFFVLAAVSAFGFILSIILSFRIKPVYQMLYSGGSFRLSHTSIH